MLGASLLSCALTLASAFTAVEAHNNAAPKPRPATIGAQRPAHFVEKEFDGVRRWVPPPTRSEKLAKRAHPSQLPTSFVDVGCWDDTGCNLYRPRALPIYLGTRYDTPAKCQMACAIRGYQYAGMEYSDQCFCGNTVTYGHLVDPEKCDMPCVGNIYQNCGGAYNLQLYRLATAPNPARAVTVANVTTSTGSYTPQGCFKDSKWDRTLPVHKGNDYQLTVEKCAEACTGYRVFGVEFNYQCFCGNNYIGTPKAYNCDRPCAGNPSQSCGGANALNIYALHSDHQQSIGSNRGNLVGPAN